MIDSDLLNDLRRSFSAALAHEDPVTARDQLLAAGWLDALAAEDPSVVALTFRLQGSYRQDAACLDDVVAQQLAKAWSSAAGDLAAGDLAVAYPMSGPDGDRASHVVLPAHRDATLLLWLPDLKPSELSIVELDDRLPDRALKGIDAAWGLIGLSGRPAGRVAALEGETAQRLWTEALGAGRVAVAHQLVAGAQVLLQMATEYARTRKQFGQPLGSFQALKHRLAETLVAITSADAAAVSAGSCPGQTNAAIAKALAGRAATIAGKNCLQIFGGIGFTSEHDFHRYFRRNLMLDRLLGDERTIQRELGRQLRSGSLRGERVVDLDCPLSVDLL
jgi:alkylation response protein AidB-like acyl-CoA dehydrogenase